MVRALTILLALTLGPAAGVAGHWNVLDLGRLYKEPHCLQAARLAFDGLRGYTRVDDVRTSEWVIYADGIEGGHDAIITCTFGDNRGTRATLVIYSTSGPIDAHMLMRRVSDLFEVHAMRITKAWKDSFN